MHLDFALDQGQWLENTVRDIQMLGGVCHAMSTEWVFARLRQQVWQPVPEYWRGVSHQRAYKILWQDALNGLWGGANYLQYLQIATRPTERFVRDPAARYRMAFHADHIYGLNQLRPHILALGAGSGIVIVMFGVDANGGNPSNWGHTVGAVRTGAGVFQFLDTNNGQYSWGAHADANTVGREIEEALDNDYGAWGIRDVYVYRVG